MADSFHPDMMTAAQYQAHRDAQAALRALIAHTECKSCRARLITIQALLKAIADDHLPF